MEEHCDLLYENLANSSIDSLEEYQDAQEVFNETELNLDRLEETNISPENLNEFTELQKESSDYSPTDSALHDGPIFETEPNVMDEDEECIITRIEPPSTEFTNLYEPTHLEKSSIHTEDAANEECSSFPDVRMTSSSSKTPFQSSSRSGETRSGEGRHGDIDDDGEENVNGKEKTTTEMFAEMIGEFRLQRKEATRAREAQDRRFELQERRFERQEQRTTALETGFAEFREQHAPPHAAEASIRRHTSQREGNSTLGILMQSITYFVCINPTCI